jgi:hypothetical protein
MLDMMRRVLKRGRSPLPAEGFCFSRPLVLLQSDDWGRVGLRDREGWEEIQKLGINLGERPYDFYSLETAEDVAAVASLLRRHRDSTGRPACLGMNFLVANVDFAKVAAGQFQKIHLRSLDQGLPDGWNRPSLFDAYREGIEAGVFSPALHGATHFCGRAVERHLADSGERGVLLRGMWNAGLPYIHWRMPWVGFEYWDPEQPQRDRFLGREEQESLIDSAVQIFTRVFSRIPRSACAPGYRANEHTHRAWARHGIRVAQNGSGNPLPPHFDANGILHLYRAIDFEPAVEPEFSLEACLRTVEASFARGLPAILSFHSINVHSTLRNFRDPSLRLLDEFLSALESKHPDLLYVCDEDLYDLVNTGTFQSKQSAVMVPVTKKIFSSVDAARWSA